MTLLWILVLALVIFAIAGGVALTRHKRSATTQPDPPPRETGPGTRGTLGPVNDTFQRDEQRMNSPASRVPAGIRGAREYAAENG